MGMNAATGQDLTGVAHMRQSVADILSTRIGTRVMRRDYGSDLPDLIDNPMTPDLVVDIFAATAQALEKWEPRYKLSKVKVAAASAGHLILDLVGIYKPNGELVTLDGIVIQ